MLGRALEAPQRLVPVPSNLPRLADELLDHRRAETGWKPLGCVEQHAYLSLATDAILSERVAAEAAEPLGIPVFPVLAYGMTPGFAAYPGTVSLRMTTYIALIEDLLEGVYRSGFRRVVLVNGHGGNAPVMTAVTEWMGRRPDASVKMHNWWAGPRFQAAVKAVDPAASHASWMENFPWTRLQGVAVPQEEKPGIDVSKLGQLSARAVKDYVGDGNYGGQYQRPDEEMLDIWNAGVEETCRLLDTTWMPA